MYRPALRRPLPFTHRTAARCFHATSRYNQGASAEILDFGTRCHAFHDIFQHVHDSTSLPWLWSIPLATVLLRALVSPVRYYLASYRRDQRLALPKLEFAAKVVERQGAMRLAAGVDANETIEKWAQQEFARRRVEIAKAHPRARPTALTSTMTNNFDVSNLGVMALVLVNTSTLLSLSATNPGMFGIDSTFLTNVAAALMFGMLAISNTYYYQGRPLSRINGKHTSLSRDHNPLRWTQTEAVVLIVGFLPAMATLFLAFSPEAVILSALSNSVYTRFERRWLDRRVRPVPRHGLRRTTAVSTTESRGHR